MFKFEFSLKSYQVIEESNLRDILLKMQLLNEDCLGFGQGKVELNRIIIHLKQQNSD